MEGLWKFGQEEQLSAQSLLSCYERQEDKNSEIDTGNEDLAYDISEGNKDSTRAIHLLFLH